MTNLNPSRRVESEPASVFLPGEFIGRAGLVRNMVWRLRHGESLGLYGGPKLGKTSLLLHLAWQLNQSASASNSGGPVAEYFDLAVDSDRTRLQVRLPKGNAMVLLDNCDSVIQQERLSLENMTGLQAGPFVFAGGRPWKDYQEEQWAGPPVKPIPLSVFLEHEARQVMAQHLSTPDQAKALTYAGTHPYLLNLFQAECVPVGNDCEFKLVVQHVKKILAPFFERCVAQLRDPVEHQVLDYVIRLGKPVNPKIVAKAVGCATIKSIANTLCAVGVLSRWIRDEEATLCVNSQLFRDWYLETKNS